MFVCVCVRLCVCAFVCACVCFFCVGELFCPYECSSLFCFVFSCVSLSCVCVRM